VEVTRNHLNRRERDHGDYDSWRLAELDFNGQQAHGLGPLSYEAQRGMYVQPIYAVT
jgi:hypothetical protein